MLKTYRIIPLVFILFLFGFTFSTVSPVIAHSYNHDLRERIKKLEAAVFPVDETAASGLTQPSSPDTPVVTEPHAKVTGGSWNPSMGMCHNSRPCMKDNKCGKMCNASVRASKGWVKPNDTLSVTIDEAKKRKKVICAMIHWVGMGERGKDRIVPCKVCPRFGGRARNCIYK